jgi:hypothetical protein
MKATDTATNQDPSPAERSFTVDATPPSTQITHHPRKRSRDRTPTFTFTANDPAASFECRIDRRSWHTCSSPATYRLSAKQHVFLVRSHDPYGNQDRTAARYAFRIRHRHHHRR